MIVLLANLATEVMILLHHIMLLWPLRSLGADLLLFDSMVPGWGRKSKPQLESELEKCFQME